MLYESSIALIVFICLINAAFATSPHCDGTVGTTLRCYETSLGLQRRLCSVTIVSGRLIFVESINVMWSLQGGLDRLEDQQSCHQERHRDKTMQTETSCMNCVGNKSCAVRRNFTAIY